MLATSLLLALAAMPQGVSGLTAHVNDPASHGATNDGLLSLNEAIALANGTLTVGQLDALEAAQVSGASGTVERVEVDAATVPQIQLSAPLDPMVGQGPLTVEGVAAGGALPQVLAGSASHAFEFGAPTVELRGFAVSGGQVAVRGVDSGGNMMMAARLSHLQLDGQSQAALHFEVTGGSTGHALGVMVMHTRITNGPLGVRVVDNGDQGGLIAVHEFVTFDGVVRGIDVTSNGMGGTSMCWTFRSSLQNGEQLLRVRRATGSTQRQMLRVVHGSYVCSGDVSDVQGVAGAETVFHHHHAHFESTGGGKAYWVHPRTAQFDIHGSEMTFVGDVEIGAGRFTQRIWHHNNEFIGGRLVLDNDGSAADLEWNRYTNCTIEVPAAARTPTLFDTCELHNTTVTANAFLGGVTLQNTFRAGGSLIGQVIETQPAPSPWWGSCTVLPEQPQIGSTVTLTTDLPPGMTVVWVLTAAFHRPTTTDYPWRFYGDPVGASVLPGLATTQSTQSLAVPAAANLVGLEFYLQPVSVPGPGQAHAPSLHLPRGGLVRPRL